jgi:hypothetical protein
MTEDEAKTKWCHRTFIPVHGATGPLLSATYCAGSACMAWRWLFESQGKQNMDEDFLPRDGQFLKQSEHGYCGLAGKQ